MMRSIRLPKSQSNNLKLQKKHHRKSSLAYNNLQKFWVKFKTSLAFLQQKNRAQRLSINQKVSLANQKFNLKRMRVIMMISILIDGFLTNLTNLQLKPLTCPLTQFYSLINLSLAMITSCRIRIISKKKTKKVPNTLTTSR